MDYKITKSISRQEIDDIMDSAMQGIAYWADEVRIKNSSNHDDVDYTSEEISRNGVLEIHNSEDDMWHELTLEKFLKGMSLKDNHDYENYDANDADDIIQLALFGEIIYG